MVGLARLLWALAVPIMALVLAGLFTWVSYNEQSLVPLAEEPIPQAQVEAEERALATEDRLRGQEDFNEMCDAEPNCRRN